MPQRYVITSKLPCLKRRIIFRYIVWEHNDISTKVFALFSCNFFLMNDRRFVFVFACFSCWPNHSNNILFIVILPAAKKNSQRMQLKREKSSLGGMWKYAHVEFLSLYIIKLLKENKHNIIISVCFFHCFLATFLYQSYNYISG